MQKGIEGPERVLAVQRVQQVQHRRNGLLQRRGESKDMVGDRVVDRLRLVVAAEHEQRPQQLGDRLIRREIGVCGGIGLQDQPVRHLRRVEEFAVAVARLPKRAAEPLQFEPAPDEAGEAAPGGYVEPVLCGPGAGRLMDLD